MQLVTLKNGKKALPSIVKEIMHALTLLLDNNAESITENIELYELYMKTHDLSYHLLEHTKKHLYTLHIIYNEQRMNNTIKNIALSAIVVEGQKISIVNPIVENPNPSLSSVEPVSQYLSAQTNKL